MVKLEEKTKQLRASASKCTKQQIAAMTTVLMALALISTLSYSQEAEQPAVAAEETKPMALPLRMSITDINGRQIDATVIERDPTGITIQRMDASGNPEARQFHIAWEKLDPSVREKLEGKKAQVAEVAKVTPAPAVLEESLLNKPFDNSILNSRQKMTKFMSELELVYNKKTGKEQELFQKFIKMSAKEQQTALIENGEDIQMHLSGFKITAVKNAGLINARTNNTTHVMAWDLAKTVPLDKTEDETVSLRPEFEKLGVVATQQVGNSCTMYSAYHLLQYLAKQHGAKIPTATGFREAAGETSPFQGMFLHEKCMAVQKILNRHIEIIHHDRSLVALNHEVIKQLIREGTPTLISWRTSAKNGYDSEGNHQSLVVGFVVKDGVTQWEILDSNHIWKDKGYKFIDAKNDTYGVISIKAK